MRRFIYFLIAVLLAHRMVHAGELKNFKNWVVGCDNLRNCMALGLPPEDGGVGYIKVSRNGAAAAEPEVTLVLYHEARTDARLDLTLDPPVSGGLPAEPVTARVDGDFLRAKLDAAAARRFIAAVQKAQSLTVKVAAPPPAPGDDPVSGTVSLSGATAAFLYLDDLQKRVGTTTALKAAGGNDPASIPPVPPEPEVAAAKMEELVEPLPRLPKALARKSGQNDDCRGDSSPMAARLSPSLTLWGVCNATGAYNVTYEFFLVENGTLRPALFELPAGFGKAAGLLTNPYISEDGRTLSEFSKGRGIGDCGASGSWAWDGTRFRLVGYAAMHECRGVVSDDWPVLYAARVK